MRNQKNQALQADVFNMPKIAWILLGFFITYILLFLLPVFLFPQNMRFFDYYIPALNPIGIDLQQMLSYSHSWHVLNQTPYIGKNLYPPLASILFVPLLAFDFFIAYKVIAIINVILYVLVTVMLPLKINKRSSFSAFLMLMLVTGLISYGLQFELERGQFNLIATSLCFCAIWLFHKHRKYRLLAYILFLISVQLKVYPLIFILMLVDNWRDWVGNIKRFSMLAGTSIGLLFILGTGEFGNFIDAIKSQAVNPASWAGNHSIRSFITWFATTIHSTWLESNSDLVQLILLGIVFLCLFIILWRAYIKNEKKFNSALFLACTISALLIPSVSHDYKLAILGAPVAVMFSEVCSHENHRNQKRQSMGFNALLIIFFGTYSSTLYSYAMKPEVFSNNFPALFVMLLLTTCFAFISYNAGYVESTD